MRAVKSRGTVPELKVRRAAQALGLRFRLERTDLPGRPDLVFPSRRVALVHGCFWHGHVCARGARMPQTNRAYWQAKIARNIARDSASLASLRKLGWIPAVIWEYEARDLASRGGSSPGALASALRLDPPRSAFHVPPRQ